MTCSGCGQQPGVCIVCPAGAECPTPVCVDCTQQELRQAKRLLEADGHGDAKLRHTTRIFNPPGQYEGDAARYDVECDLCGWLVAADTVEEAEAIVRLHEEFVAVLVDRWEVPS